MTTRAIGRNRLNKRTHLACSVVHFRTSRKVVWQLGNVGRDPPSYVHGEDVGYVGISSGLTSVHIGERLSVQYFIASGNLLYPLAAGSDG